MRSRSTRALSELLPHLAANVRESQQIISTTAFGFSGFQGIPNLIGPFNVFHLVCAALLAYSVFMLRRNYDLRPAVQEL